MYNSGRVTGDGREHQGAARLVRRFFRRLYLLMIIMVWIPLTVGEAKASAYQNTYTTTVMVYMCGSNLESMFGAASRDIMEMMNSGLNTDFTNVVIMAGGSREWDLGFAPKETAIVNLGKRGMRTVWKSEEPMNMASSETLSYFIDYCYDQFPADRFALILWDHGGGPNEGVCYDELFGWNTLSVQDLITAFDDSDFFLYGRKLDWIGFDACLMASVETACSLQQYADYMIASEAQEPSSGWNYAFLRGLEKDRNTLDTGKRIVDAYFDGMDEYKDTLTLSLIDLSQVLNVSKAMDNYFSRQYIALTEETFSAFSRERMSVKCFGSAEYDTSQDFDLVDLYGLIETNEDTGGSGQNLMAAIEAAVPYSRSNAEGANGLSVYHPGVNCDHYSGKWAMNYSTSFRGMSSEYALYIRRYGQILTGRELGNWSSLVTVSGETETGERLFSVQLTEEQAEHFDHATLNVIERIRANGNLTDEYQSVWETPYLRLDENNTLTAAFPNQAVFVVDDQSGERLAGPVDFKISRDGKLLVFVIFADEDGIVDAQQLITMFTCAVSEDSGKVEIESIQPLDEGTQSCSPRMELSENMLDELECSYVIFHIQNRHPNYKGQELLGLRDWDSNGNFIYEMIPMPRKWHFEVRENNVPEELLYVTFQITDTQSITHSSSLCPVGESGIQGFEMIGSVEDGGLTIRHPKADIYPESELVAIGMSLQEKDERAARFEAYDFMLNGRIRMESMRFSCKGENDLVITLTKNRLVGIDKLEKIEFDLDLYSETYEALGKEHVCLVMPEALSLPWANEPGLAYYEDGDLRWELQAIEQNGIGTLAVLFSAEDQTGKETQIEFTGIALNQFCVWKGSNLRLESNLTVRSEERIYSDPTVMSSTFESETTLTDALSNLGIETINRVRFFYRVDSGEEIRTADFRLRDPVPYQVTKQQTETLHRNLMKENGIRLDLEQIDAYDDYGLNKTIQVLGLWIENQTEETQHVVLDSFRFNGERAYNDLYEGKVEAVLPASTCRYVFIQIQADVPEEEIRTAGFTVYIKDLLEENIRIDVR